jgi:hypothetical protein
MPVMTNLDIERIRHAANTDVIRLLLTKYFVKKGFLNEDGGLDRRVNPVMMQDLPLSVPVLAGKLEIEPHAVEIDPTTGCGVIGWNLFVLGTHRMYLGETYHHNLPELARQIKAGTIRPDIHGSSRRESTPKHVITFITRTLGQSEGGYVDFSRNRLGVTSPAWYRGGRGPSQEAQFFTRSGYGT